MVDSAALEGRRQLVLGDLWAGSRSRDALMVLGFAALVGLFAQISIKLPFTPVPITGQTFAVLLGGMAVGTWRAVAGMLLYLIAGLAGIPWFASGAGGLAVATSPTFGYIVGFVVAALAMGKLAALGLDRRPQTLLAAMVAGNGLIYLCGAGWLALALHLGAGRAVALGVTPFLLGDAIKAALAMVLLPGTWRLLGSPLGPRTRSSNSAP